MYVVIIYFLQEISPFYIKILLLIKFAAKYFNFFTDTYANPQKLKNAIFSHR